MPILCHQHHDPATHPRDDGQQPGARHDLRHGLHSTLSAHGLHVTVSLTIAPPWACVGCCRCAQCPRAAVPPVGPAPRFADAAESGVQTCAEAAAPAKTAAAPAKCSPTAAAPAVGATTTAVAAVDVNDTTAAAAVDVNDTDSQMTTTAAAAAVVADDDAADDDEGLDSQMTTDATPSPVPLRRQGDDQDEDEWERLVSSPVPLRRHGDDQDEDEWERQVSSPVLCKRLVPCNDGSSSPVLCKRLVRHDAEPGASLSSADAADAMRSLRRSAAASPDSSPVRVRPQPVRVPSPVLYASARQPVPGMQLFHARQPAPVMQTAPVMQPFPVRQPVPVMQARPVHKPVHLPPPIGSGIAAAIAGSNLLVLVQDGGYLASLNAQLRAGVSSNRRDALDLAGKLPLAIKALAVGISPAELNIDPSQAGGLLGKFDAKITRVGALPPGIPAAPCLQHADPNRGGIEIKGARCYRGRKTFQFSRLRPSTPFEHLLFVARERDPADWTDVRELDRCFWLGHVARVDFDAALAAWTRKPRRGLASAARACDTEHCASVTVGSRRHGWLGACVQWVRFGMLDRAWWDAHVVGAQLGIGVRGNV